jgi:FlaA1/EpsC-like NDP-sugar epimerase
MGWCMVRIAYRMLYEQMRSRMRASDGSLRRALVLGAGDAGGCCWPASSTGLVGAGLLDDDPAKQGTRIAGVPVLGRWPTRRDWRSERTATHLIVALPSAKGAQRRQALALAAARSCVVLTVPSSEELRSGRRRIERLRDIEPEDLLGRDPVQLDEAGISETLPAGGAGHRRRWQHRQRAVPPGGALRPGAAGAATS